MPTLRPVSRAATRHTAPSRDPHLHRHRGRHVRIWDWGRVAAETLAALGWPRLVALHRWQDLGGHDGLGVDDAGSHADDVARDQTRAVGGGERPQVAIGAFGPDHMTGYC